MNKLVQILSSLFEIHRENRYVLEFSFLDFGIINMMHVPKYRTFLVEAAPNKQVIISDGKYMIITLLAK